MYLRRGLRKVDFLTYLNQKFGELESNLSERERDLTWSGVLLLFQLLVVLRKWFFLWVWTPLWMMILICSKSLEKCVNFSNNLIFLKFGVFRLVLTNLFVSLFFDETKTFVFWCSLSFARTVGACIDWWMTLSSTTVPIGGKMMIYVYCIPTFHSEFHDSELIWPNEGVFKTCFSKGPNVRKSWIVAKWVGERCFFSFWIDSFLLSGHGQVLLESMSRWIIFTLFQLLMIYEFTMSSQMCICSWCVLTVKLHPVHVDAS
jgi:hypothetical protein